MTRSPDASLPAATVPQPPLQPVCAAACNQGVLICCCGLPPSTTLCALSLEVPVHTAVFLAATCPPCSRSTCAWQTRPGAAERSCWPSCCCSRRDSRPTSHSQTYPMWVGPGRTTRRGGTEFRGYGPCRRGLGGPAGLARKARLGAPDHDNAVRAVPICGPAGKTSLSKERRCNAA